MAVKKRPGLGRGLDALITKPEAESESSEGSILEIEISKIEPNRTQPRRNFDDEELRELAESIRVYGVISPLVVRKDGGYYAIVAGERRWRAARLAGLKTLPVILREFDEKETLEVALIENLQRADLNPVEEAAAFKRLTDEFGMTQEDIAERLGKSRSAVANALRLLNLPEAVREMLVAGRLSSGHAKVLLGISDDGLLLDLAGKAADGGLSVRELEESVKQERDLLSTAKDAKIRKKERSSHNPYVGLERELTDRLLAKTRIKPDKSGDKGKIEIEFATKDELDRLYLVLRNLKGE